MFRTAAGNGIYLKAYVGDCMTLLSFDMDDNLNTEDFVGFSIEYEVPSGKRFPVMNKINFEGSDKLLPSMDAPIQKFRWLHVPGSTQQTLNDIEYGEYTYYVSASYYDKAGGALKPVDPKLTVTAGVKVGNFLDGPIELAFTRSYVNSQAYLYRFGTNAAIVPSGDWMFDTSKHFTTNNGRSFTYEDLYMYLGFTARKRILEELDAAIKDKTVTLDMFIYDFDEPQVAERCLKLAAEGRLRIISDDYVKKTTDKETGKVKQEGHGLPKASETLFFNQFNKVKKGKSDIVRGHFARFQHHKVIIFYKNGNPYQVMTGSTNFSITGLCVNANHLVIIRDKDIAALYSEVFKNSWGLEAMKAFSKNKLATKKYHFTTEGQGSVDFTFSPHSEEFAGKTLDAITSVIDKAKSSVLFSVMQMSGSGGSVMPALSGLHDKGTLFTYGVSDAVDKNAISLYKPGSKKGILVNAQSIARILPKPFKQEVTYKAHKIHHKFVVTDFNDKNPYVFFGSSNLALGGEKQNGDNLITVRDTEVATVFAIEALRLVDHFHFRAAVKASNESGDALALKKDNSWAKDYFKKGTIRFLDRKLFV